MIQGDVYEWADDSGRKVWIHIMRVDESGMATVSRRFGVEQYGDPRQFTVPTSYVPYLAAPADLDLEHAGVVEWEAVPGIDRCFTSVGHDPQDIRLVIGVEEGHLGDVRACLEERSRRSPRHTVGPPAKDCIMRRQVPRDRDPLGDELE